MDPYGSGRIPYEDGSFIPSGSNRYSNSGYPPYYSPFTHPPQPPPPPPPPNPHTHQDFGVNSSWCPPYPPPPPGPVYPHAQPPPGGWHSSNSFSQDPYPYNHQGSFHSDVSYHHHQTSGFYNQSSSGFEHSSSDLGYQSTNPSIYPHTETTAPPTNPPAIPSNTSTATSLYPLDDVLSELHLSPHPLPVESPSLTSSFNGRPRPGSQSFEYSSQSFSSNHGSFSGHSLQYGRYSLNSCDSVHSASSLGAFGSQDYDRLQVVPFEPSGGSLKVFLLHGTLDVWIFEAKNLPNMDLFSEKLRQVFANRGPGKTASKIEQHSSHQKIITSDPYVSICLSNAVIARTRVINNDQNPVWTQHFRVPVAHHVAEVLFIVKDSDFLGAQLIGNVSIPAARIMTGQEISGWFTVLGSNGKACKEGAELKLSIQYFPVEDQSLYKFGVGSGPNYVGVPNTYFPLRKGGKVTLYQDAHVPDNYLPAIKLDQQVPYEHGKCWQDICQAILEARRLIYITGWSVYHKIKLVHESNNSGSSLPLDSTLGDLLKFKSQEGLRVLLLVWDDPTSRQILGIRTEGLMQTHDEETRRFFKHSSVQVLLCPRYGGKRHSWVKQQEVGTIFTHHQKSVLVDTEAAGGRRKITAFLGGLDLCDGRFDTPEHSLFRTLQTVHANDYHNPTFAAGVEFGGPREPWHDLHCKVDGPAAYDVLTNFEQRWHKAAKHGIGKFKKWNDDALLKLDRIADMIGLSQLNNSDENDPETWHVQVFRSIDSSSVKGFPKDVREAETKNLICGKNVVIDMSIHTAYVKAIRSAQHFIYIENQYFIGSSYNWSSHTDAGANNLIPMELALKIAGKIRANERFAVYVVIPMWPEGIPTSPLMQRILFWQGQTMQMMYEIIFKALEEVGLEKMYHPEDYLNFFCLGNRELRDENKTPPKSAPLENTPHARAQKNRRFMIYVHSKGMIVDDEYVILGSANINQRSMDGSRDSEIAMGAYQPQYTWAKKQDNPHGQIYGYRISLWAEHIGVLEDCFQHPESLECVRRVHDLSVRYWKQFTAEEVTEMKGHLLKYPVRVLENGKVTSLPGCETFPDIGGNILGTSSFITENLTT